MQSVNSELNRQQNYSVDYRLSRLHGFFKNHFQFPIFIINGDNNMSAFHEYRLAHSCYVTVGTLPLMLRLVQ